MGLEDLTERLFGLGKYNKGATTTPTQPVKSNLEEVLKKKKKLGNVDTGIQAIRSGKLGAPVIPKD